VKQAIVVLALLISGCASQPKPATVVAPGAAPTDKSAEVLKAVQEAIDKGYKIVNEDGQTMYCRKSPKTGSRVQINLTCLTEDQLVTQRRASRDYVEMIQKNSNPGITQ
jgi:hypothetical protein